MYFSFSSTTFLIAVAVAQLFAAPVQADSCDSDCLAVTSKLLNCGGSNVDFSNSPKLDIVMDSCLCTNETISAFQGCENCRSIHKVVLSTDKLIADCKRADPSRTYVASNNVNKASSNTRSMANNRSSRVGAVVTIIAVGLAISLS